MSPLPIPRGIRVFAALARLFKVGPPNANGSIIGACRELREGESALGISTAGEAAYLPTSSPIHSGDLTSLTSQYNSRTLRLRPRLSDIIRIRSPLWTTGRKPTSTCAGRKLRMERHIVVGVREGARRVQR
jgi:hypothetical protein